MLRPHLNLQLRKNAATALKWHKFLAIEANATSVPLQM
jgi:hypothetical protein